MHLAGIVLTVIGVVILFAGSMGWRFHRATREAESGSLLDAIDGGLLATLSGIFHLLEEVFKDRSSPLFPVAILMIVGLAMGAVGAALCWLG